MADTAKPEGRAMNEEGENSLPPDFLDGLRHAACEDEAAGHHLQAEYMRRAADEISRLRLLAATLQKTIDELTLALRTVLRNGTE